MNASKNVVASTLERWLKLLAVSSLLALASCTPIDAPQQVMAAEPTFAEFSHNFLEAYWQLEPEAALYNGRYEFADQMQIPDQAYRDQVTAFVDAQRDLLAQFDPATLSNSDAGDYAIIANQLDSMLWYQDTFKLHTWNPASYNIASVIGLILNTDYTDLEVRLLQIGKRLDRASAYYQAAEEAIDRPALPYTELAIQQTAGVIGFLKTELAEAIAESTLPDDGKQKLNASNLKAQQAAQGYLDFLNGLLPQLKAGDARDFRIGETLYEQKFQLDINAGYTAKQMYQLALEDKAQLHQKMAALADQLWAKYYPNQTPPADAMQKVRMVLDRIADSHADADAFVEEVREQIPQLTQFVVDHDLIDVDPEKPLVVREAPEYLRGFAVAFISAPGPYDTQANTYYSVNPPQYYPPEQQESYLREYNDYTLQIINIHEAVPGHYTQLVHSNKSPSLIKAIFGNGAMVEGWAVYTERMMLEEGYGNDSPELWLMYYKWNLRTVCNTILDYSTQVLGMDEEAALDLLINQAFQERTEALGKWRRATISQVQLTSYFTGYKAIYSFRDAQRAQQGEAFDLKQFHNRFLSYGSAPIPLIIAAMQATQ